MANAKVTFYTRQVLALLKEFNREALAQVALQIEANTKVNISVNNQIDTGFMMNSVYTILSQRSGYAMAGAAARARAADREMAPQAELPNDALAGVAVGAEYAIYQEVKNSFLWRAAEQVKAEAPELVKSVYRRRL